MNVDSVYHDGSGTCWHVGDLLASKHPRTSRRVETRPLLEPYLGLTPWERDGGTPAEVRDHARRRGSDQVAAPSPKREHVEHVLRIASQLQDGIEPAPLIIGLDGRLWDGLHRLIAYDLVGRESCYALDFSDRATRDPDWSFDGLAGLLDPSHLDPHTLSSLQGRFWSAPGFPHLVCDELLTPDLLKSGHQEMLHLRGWQKVVTDFYSQQEIAYPRREATGNALRRIVEGFYSRSMRSWIASCTGLVVDVVGRRPTCVLHRMSKGDYVGFHNDYRPMGEAVRLVVFLGQESGEEEEGALVIMDSVRNEPLEVVLPQPGRLLLFGISDKSTHLVTEVTNADRYSMVFSYYSEELA